MEAIANRENKKRYLKSKADEIISIKRRLEEELSEVELINDNWKVLKDAESEIISREHYENVKTLLKETDSFLCKNASAIINTDTISISQEADLFSKTLIGSELRKERAGELFQYGFEVKYLPLARYLQTASKYISTENWCTAREEFRLARVFDKYLELRNAKATTLLQIPRQQYPSRPKTHHDALLEEVSWMSNDFRCESEWKIKIAHQLAVEAREVVLKKLCVWSSTKAIPRNKPLSLSNELFYRVTLPLSPPVQKIDLKEPFQILIDHDELVQLCDFGDKIDNSILGDLIITAEYQLGTSASFPNTIWYEHEDALLLELGKRFKCNWILISSSLNTQIYGGKSIRGPLGCQERFEELEKKSVSPKPQLTSPNPPLIHPHLLEKHNVKLGLMRGANTKIITPRSVVPKKISFNVHPSHEAAARKANQNISKLLTPSELAQKRLQRTRLVNEAGTLNVPSIPRSTPSPIPSNPSQLQQSTSTTSSSGIIPNLPPMPSAIPSVNPPTNGVYNNMVSSMNSSAATTAAQQIAAGMMRSGMMRPPSGSVPSASLANSQSSLKSNSSVNPMMAQLQQLQQLHQLQQASHFGDSPSKSSNFRPAQQQIRPPQSANGPINFMNLSAGITPLQMQQLQHHKSNLQQQHLQQMYTKSIQTRPPNPSAFFPKMGTGQNDQREEEQDSDQINSSNNMNLRTSPRKTSNK